MLDSLRSSIIEGASCSLNISLRSIFNEGGLRKKQIRSSRSARSKLTVLCSAEMNSACAYNSMLDSLRSSIIEGGFGKKQIRSSRSARSKLTVFVLGGNEFRLRILLLRRLNIAKKLLKILDAERGSDDEICYKAHEEELTTLCVKILVSLSNVWSAEQ